MLQTTHHPLIYNFFRLYSKFILSLNFSDIEIIGEYEDSTKSILLIVNHFSWWDGFWILNLNEKVFKKHFYFMMDEKQLSKYWYFRYCGGFSVNKDSKSLIKSIDYAINLLKMPDNLVLIFPQGKLYSLYTSEFSFQNGVNKIINSRNSNFEVYFVVNLLEYLNKPKPKVYTYFEKFSNQSLENTKIEKYYSLFYQKCLDFHKKICI